MAIHRRTLNRVASTSVGSGILARGVGIGFALQVAGAGSAFVMQLCLARWLGATAYGTYTYVIAWSGILAVVAGMGFPTLALRVLPDYSTREDWARVKGVLATSLVWTVLIGGLIALLGIALVLSLGWQGRASVLDTVTGFVMVPVLALMALQLEMVRSFRRLGLAYAPSLLLRPSLIILGCGCVLAVGHRLDSTIALALTATATVFAIGLQAWRFRRALGPIVLSARAVYDRRIWIKAALPLLLVSGFIVIIEQADIVMVGAILGDRAAGLYGAAAKTASVVGLILISVNAIGAPMFSVLFAQNRQKDLQQLVSAIAAWAFWPSCLVSIVLATCAPLVLTIFGPGFGSAAWQLRVLLVGQIVNAAAGSVGLLILLSGRQNVAARIYGWVALIHLVLLAVLTPVFGTIGAAAATTLTMSLWNVWLHAAVVRELNIRPSIIFNLRSARADGPSRHLMPPLG
ncbi:MAG TPA: oligosaccharide flippase family protein [Solirubrobacteraceae bacterium]